MIYNRLDKLLTEKRISIPVLAEKIGMTKGGLYTSLERKTLSISTLEKISEVLNTPITYFFEDDHFSSSILESLKTENLNLKSEIEQLKNILEDKKLIIDLYKSKTTSLVLGEMLIKGFHLHEEEMLNNLSTEEIKNIKESLVDYKEPTEFVKLITQYLDSRFKK